MHELSGELLMTPVHDERHFRTRCPLLQTTISSFDAGRRRQGERLASYCRISHNIMNHHINVCVCSRKILFTILRVQKNKERKKNGRNSISILPFNGAWWCVESLVNSASTTELRVPPHTMLEKWTSRRPSEYE